MTDFLPDPRDRLEVPICKAIESNDFKRALKLVEKRLAKSSEPYLQALKFFIQCCHPIITERGKALGTILDLGELSGRYYAASELELYDEGAKALFPGRQGKESNVICKMRADAVKAAPKDEKLALACFRACLKRDNLEYAQQIANSLEKNFPSNHGYQFWSITASAAYALSPSCPTQAAQMFSRLAYSKIKNLASSTLKVTDQSQPSTRSIQTPEELLLFHRLLAAQGKDEEGLRICRDERLGPTSKIAKGQWIFQRGQLQLLELGEQWQELFNTCLELLSASRTNNKSSTTYDARGADWAVWKGFLRAVSELESGDAVAMAYAELQAHLAKDSGLDKTYQRNALLAKLEFTFAIAPDFLPQETSRLEGKKETRYYCYENSRTNWSVSDISARVIALCVYLHQYGHTSSAFGDIKIYVEKLSLEEQKTFLIVMPHFLTEIDTGMALYTGRKLQQGKDHSYHQYFPPRRDLYTTDRITVGITQSKLEYLIKSSMAETTRDALLQHSGDENLQCDWCAEACGVLCTPCLRSLTIQALHAYGWAMNDDGRIVESLKPTDRHPADEWAILAAMGLTKLAGCEPWTAGNEQTSFSTPKVQQLFRATAILEFAHTYSKANPQIQLLLIRLYSQLGAGSLAMRAYNRLGLKQIQGDTLSYILFDRISSLHPHPVADYISGVKEVLDPSTQLTKLQRLYKGARNQIITNSWRSFEHGSYDSIFQLMEVSDKLSRSIALAMSAIELRKIDRLTKAESVLDKNSHGYDVLLDYSDHSDYSSFPNYEQSEQSPFEMYIRTAPGPSLFRTQAFLLLEELWMLTSSASESKAKQTAAQVRLRNLRDVTSRIREEASLRGQLTMPENCLVYTGVNLIDFVGVACDSSLSNHEEAMVFFGSSALRHISTLMDILNEESYGFHEIDWVPRFMTTLHPMYTAHEAATLVIAVAGYLCSSGVWTHPKAKLVIAQLKDAAMRLRRQIGEQSALVRKKVNGGQWLDFVLEAVQFGNPNDFSDSKDKSEDVEKKGSVRDLVRNLDFQAQIPQTIGHSFTKFFGTDFLEHWAGELVDSWRESVMGLASLKSD